MDIYVNDEETLLAQIKQIKAAQKEYSTYSQEQVDKIFRAVAMVANDNRINFAKMAYEETAGQRGRRYVFTGQFTNCK